jgi:ferric-dicitrate binding protein FerR (iron transport regulator)
MNDEAPDLLARALSGDLSPEESDRLLEICRGDASVRTEFGRLAITERLLQAVHTDVSPEIAAREVVQRLAPSVPFERERLIEHVMRKTWWSVYGPKLAWAAGIVLLLGFGSWATLERRTVATIARTESATWAGTSQEVGQGLRKGQSVSLKQGLVEIKFGNGAVVVIEGPAEFEVRSKTAAFLHRGRAVARVPEQARGFVIDSPRGRLVDLGTEFGIAVGDAGETEVHVLEGRVEAELPGRSKPVELRAAEAMRLASTGTTWIPVDETAFVTEMPPRAEDAPGFIHWSFDEGEGTTARNSGRGLAGEEAHLTLKSYSPEGALPMWMEGVFGAALQFDGKSSFAECRYRGISGRQSRTIAAWVRVPADFHEAEGYGMVGWGIVSPPGRAWQLSANPVVRDGEIGRLRIGASDGSVVGTTDLRDGKWHHVSAVMYGGVRANTATHVLLYVDGNLEPASRKGVREIVTDTENAPHGIFAGRNVGYRGQPLEQMLPGGAFFRGSVDEVFIAAGALSQEQIRKIMRENRL